MNLDYFWTDNETMPLLQALQRWAEQMTTIKERQVILKNAGIHQALINQLNTDEPQQFAMRLVAQSKDYSFSVRQPNYHPMINFLKHLCQIAENEISYLSDEDFTLFSQLVDQGQEKLKILASRSAVGRIESPKGQAIGTGFLVKKDLLITCYHVLRNHTQAWVRFNYNSQNTARDTDAFAIAIDLNFVSYSGINDFDYALVRLERPPTQIISSLSQKEINTDDIISIIHHPNGELATVSPPGKITEVGQTILHNIPTEHGSSGAPIFNQSWEVIAIHRGNSGIMAARPTDNMTGIPVNQFRDKILPKIS